jgi:hypothetical protein
MAKRRKKQLRLRLPFSLEQANMLISLTPPNPLTWADTGEPVRAGELARGRYFEVDLPSGKVMPKYRRKNVLPAHK